MGWVNLISCLLPDPTKIRLETWGIEPAPPTGLPQDWGSGGYRHWRAGIIGWLEFLSEAGTERAIIDSATNLEQQVGAASRPAHLL